MKLRFLSIRRGEGIQGLRRSHPASNAEASRKIAEKAIKLDGELSEGALVSAVALPARIVVRLGKRAKVAVIA